MSANGNRRTAPPATNRQMTSTGTAITNNRTAKSFAAPQVMVNANLIALNDNQQNKTMTSNSNKLSTPLFFGGIHLFHTYLDAYLLQIFRMLLPFLQKFDRKDSFAYRHHHHRPHRYAALLDGFILGAAGAIINDSVCRIRSAISAKSTK